MVKAAPLGVEILRDTWINTARFKIHRRFGEGLQRLVALADKATPVERIGIHDRHVGKDRAVLLLSISKAEHPTKVELFLTKISVQAIASDFCAIEIAVRRTADRRGLLWRGRAAHNGKDLTREHHAHAAGEIPFDLIPVIIIIAVEPALVFTRNPFGFTDMRTDSPGDRPKRSRQRKRIKAAFVSAYTVRTEAKEVRKPVFFLQ